jgi:hypothetical protein
MMKLIFVLTVLPCIATAQIDNEALIRIPETYCKTGQIRPAGESIYLNLVYHTVKADGSVGYTFASTLEMNEEGKILNQNHISAVKSCEPLDMLTGHPAGTLILTENKNTTLYLYNKTGKPQVLKDFPGTTKGKFLGKHNGSTLFAIIKMTEVVAVSNNSKQSTINEPRGSVVIYTIAIDGSVTELFTLEKLSLQERSLAMPTLNGNFIYFMDPYSGRLSIFTADRGKKVIETDHQLNGAPDEKITWDEPVAHPEGYTYLRVSRAQVKPVFRFKEAWIIEVDTMGNKTHEAELDEIIEPEERHDMIATKDNGLLLLTTSSKPELYKFDSNLNLEWKKSYRLNKTFMPSALAELEDGRILVLAFMPHLGKMKPYLITLDKNGNALTMFY